MTVETAVVQRCPVSQGLADAAVGVVTVDTDQKVSAEEPGLDRVGRAFVGVCRNLAVALGAGMAQKIMVVRL